MVLTHTTNHTYSHPFPTVTLAYFIRYSSPQLNPFAAHVLSTDTISSHVDPATGRLHTTRLHLKKSRVPAAVLKLLPASMSGGPSSSGGNGGERSSYILETSVVDIKEGWMRSESRNLDHVSVLSVVERQLYTAPPPSLSLQVVDENEKMVAPTSLASGTTDVTTTMVFRSRVGERIRDRLGQSHQHQQQHAALTQESSSHSSSGTGTGSGGASWLSRLGALGVQRSIETIASSRTENQLGKSREGMRIILERIRQSGVMGVLELQRRAREKGLDIS